MFDYWADLVVYLLLLKSSMANHNALVHSSKKIHQMLSFSV